MMTITCVTSRYLPNLRYIARLCEVDCAVVLDLAPLPHQNKNSFVSRNRIQDRLGKWRWLSVPVRRKGIRYISEARIDETNHNWIDKHLGTLENAYPNHNKIAADFLIRLRETLNANDGSLLDLNLRSLNLILELLELGGRSLIMQSSILEAHSKEHRLEVAKLLNAGCYVAGQVEHKAMKDSGCIQRMHMSNIRVVRSPELDTLNFSLNEIRYLSCVHAICTLGPEKTREIVDRLVLSFMS